MYSMVGGWEEWYTQGVVGWVYREEGMGGIYPVFTSMLAPLPDVLVHSQQFYKKDEVEAAQGPWVRRRVSDDGSRVPSSSLFGVQTSHSANSKETKRAEATLELLPSLRVYSRERPCRYPISPLFSQEERSNSARRSIPFLTP